MKVYVGKIAWSSSGWQGFPKKIEDYKKDVKRSGFDYVREYKYAHEWFNFYEDFDEKYYFGFFWKGEVEKDSIICWVSKDVNDGKMKLIGFYVEAESPSKEEREKIKNKKNSLKPQYYKELGAKTKKEFLVWHPNIKAPKEKSFKLKEPIPINQKEVYGITLGQVNVFGCRHKNIKKLKKWLEENQEYLKVEKEKIDYLLKKLEEVSENINKKNKNSYQLNKITNIINAINTKPFIILSGISGTGKTQIARIISAGIVSYKKND